MQRRIYLASPYTSTDARLREARYWAACSAAALVMEKGDLVFSPTSLPEFMYSVWTQPGDIVFEPFCGSGSSIIAAQKTGRVARAMEIAPAYVDVAIIRFMRSFPDIPVKLKESGETFETVSTRRGLK